MSSPAVGSVLPFASLTARAKVFGGAPRDAIIAASVLERGLVFGFNRAADHMGAVLSDYRFCCFSYFCRRRTKIRTAHEYQQVFCSPGSGLSVYSLSFFRQRKNKQEKKIRRNNFGDTDKPS